VNCEAASGQCSRRYWASPSDEWASAEPGRRGATLAVHSTLGYAGGFVGPLALGVTLDLLGGASVLGWGLAFGHVTLVLIAGAIAFVALRPADLAGDRAAVATPRTTMPRAGA